MKIDEYLEETDPEVMVKLQKLRAKLLKGETAYEAFKAELLKDSTVKREYDKLEPKFREIRKRLNKKKEDK